MSQQVVALFAVAAFTAFYLALPPGIAFARRHPERGLIARLTVLSLLSFLLWLALIAWAASDRRDDALISRWVARLRTGHGMTLAVGALVVLGLAGSAWAMLG